VRVRPDATPWRQQAGVLRQALEGRATRQAQDVPGEQE
jgi:hypothetical protein